MAENVTNYFQTLFQEAHRATMMSRFVEADDICHRLLREPSLPLLYRAGCNLMLSFGNDNPVGFAKEAVTWYEEMYNEVRDHPVDGPHHLGLLQQARDALLDAESRFAEPIDDEDKSDEEEIGHKEAGDDGSAERVSESEFEEKQESTGQEGTPMNMPSSSLGGQTVVAESSQIATQVEEGIVATTKKDKDSSEEEEEGEE